MKKIIITCTAIFFFAFNSFAQIKIFPGGNITVGNTSAPTSGFKMHVQGNSLFSTSSFTGNSAAFIRGMNGHSSATTPDYTWWGNDETGIFHPSNDFIGFSTASRERMRITNTGNLLIGGTYNGGYRLGIDAAQNLGALSTATNFTIKYGYAHASYVNESTTKNWVVVYNEDENFAVLGNGDVYAKHYYTYSDSVLKENIATLTDSRTKILGLRGVSYNLKTPVLANALDTTTIIDNTPPRNEFGLIAEEVEQIVPEAVSTDDNGIKAVAYSGIVPLLIEAYKQDHAELEALKAQLQQCCASNGSSDLDGFRLMTPANDKSSNYNSDGARLDQNIPNPFNLQTQIHFYLPENAISKSLMIFDMQGNLLKQYSLTEKGESKININGNEFHAGMYLYSLIIDGKEIDTKRMILTN